MIDSVLTELHYCSNAAVPRVVGLLYKFETNQRVGTTNRVPLSVRYVACIPDRVVLSLVELNSGCNESSEV